MESCGGLSRPILAETALDQIWGSLAEVGDVSVESKSVDFSPKDVSVEAVAS